MLFHKPNAVAGATLPSRARDFDILVITTHGRNLLRGPAFTLSNNSVGSRPARLRKGVTAVVSPELLTNDCKQSPSTSLQPAAAEEESHYSEQALIADYQYTLRYYRSLKKQVGTWQAAFVSQHQRQPTAEDATAQCGREYGVLYGTFLELRTRLLIELPRLKARLVASFPEGHPAGSSGREHPQGRAAGGSGDRHAVNANTTIAGTAGNTHSPSPQQQQQQPLQQVDSVSTWLRADRYRRQRAVATAALAAVVVPAGGQDGEVADVVGRGSIAAAAGASTAALASAATAAKSEDPVDHLHSERPGQLEGLTVAGQQVLYQPVIQLTPADPRLREPPVASASVGVPGGGVTAAGRGAPDSGPVADLTTTSTPAGMWVGAQATPLGGIGASAPSAPSHPQGQLPSPPAPAPGPASAIGGGLAPPSPEAAATVFPAGGQQPQGLADWPSGAGDVAAAAKGAAAAPALQQHLEEDMRVAAGGRAKNALLAALQYKRTGKAASGAGAGGQQQQAADGKAGSGEDGEQQLGAGVAPEGVEVEVRRGDAAGAYSGRNRRSEELPEGFMLCP